MLCLKVGLEMYNKIINLSAAVIQIRRTSTSWTKILNTKQSFGGFMPPPVHEIYFGSELVNAVLLLSMRDASLEPELVTRPNWRDLVEETETKLATYRKFEK